MRFEDIKKGDKILWLSSGCCNLPDKTLEGVAQKFIKADEKNWRVDVWMVKWEGLSVPVTKTTFKGLERT